MAVDLKPALETALGDESNEIWTTTELDTILGYALDQVNQHRQRYVRDTIAFVADQDTYTLTNVWTATRIDILDGDGKMIRTLNGGTWEVWGDNNSEGQTIYVNPRFVMVGYSMRVHGYGPYDFTTNEPDTLTQAAIVALARAEALRRLSSDRARFRQWAQTNPRGDSSVSEGLQTVNEADAEAARMLRQIRLIKRPTAGRF